MSPAEDDLYSGAAKRCIELRLTRTRQCENFLSRLGRDEIDVAEVIIRFRPMTRSA
jgi:hypothetical protein